MAKVKIGYAPVYNATAVRLVRDGDGHTGWVYVEAIGEDGKATRVLAIFGPEQAAPAILPAGIETREEAA